MTRKQENLVLQHNEQIKNKSKPTLSINTFSFSPSKEKEQRIQPER